MKTSHTPMTVLAAVVLGGVMTPDARSFLVNSSVMDQNTQQLTLVHPWTAGFGI